MVVVIIGEALCLGTAFAAPKNSHVSRCCMETNARSRHKILLLCLGFYAAIVGASNCAGAVAFGVGDSHEVGFLWPGVQKKPAAQNRSVYVNHLIGMALGVINITDGQVYFRSSHAFDALPTAVQAHNGGGRTIILRTDGLYSYLFASYSGYGSEVWYVGNVSGIITIPFLVAGHCLTGWTLFDTGSADVPDGGVTVMLLGVALGVLALARRFLMR
jgi:hypothetical protein